MICVCARARRLFARLEAPNHPLTQDYARNPSVLELHEPEHSVIVVLP